MSIDFAKWSLALAMTETANNSQAWGDNGQAVGRWQMHPSFIQQWSEGVRWGLDWTWDQVCRVALTAFFMERSRVYTDPVHLAMEFHLGVEGVANGGWDQPYATAFLRFYNAP